MAMSTHGMSTSFPSSIPQLKYDVFMSFRGEDTRKGFTDHLYSALEQQGIITFRDDPELQKGKAIYPELLTAIEESRFALIVLSQNYASSTWCLEELSKILECMEARKTVMPIFYDVDPSNVRKTTGSFAEAFTKHEERFSNDTEKVQRWRSALKQVANFSGWNSKDWYESKLIKDIVEVIWTKLQPTLFSSLENLVGIDSRLKPIKLHLAAGEDDVRFIGIWGMGGIGKTTTARVVYERISSEFECSFLVTDVRNMVEKSGLVNLQKQLLSGIWRKNDDISDFHQGATIISRFLCRKKVLLILDDVNHLDHLKYLAGKKTWFGPGSRVIITTRNEHLLVRHGVERRLKVEGLNSDDALKLFSLNAFKKDYPEQNYLHLSNEVVSYAQGLPLALEVLGSFLHGRGLSEWTCALRKLGKVCNSEIFDVLKISYDGLDEEEKKIFLDIACFFAKENRDRVTEILTACDFSAIIGINVLIERSLLTDWDERLWMHDSLQEMGREIVIRESPNELGRRSRLWLCEDVNYVLRKNTGTEILEGIVLQSTTDEPGVIVDASAFSMMNKLRYLKINNVILSNGLQYLPNSLRILEWVGYPLKSFPSHFNPEKLVELNLCNSCIKKFQMGVKPLYNLRTINLSHSLNLVNTPNFKSMPNLELLILEGCILLREVDQSIDVLERLTLLNLKDCKNLVGLPNSVCGLKSLKVLNISGCSKFEKLPNELGHVECLEELDMSGTAISEVPSSLGLLKNLKALSCHGCRQSPKWWNMIFKPFQLLLKGSLVPAPLSLPSLSGLNFLTRLNLSDCNLLEGAMLDDLSCLSSLRILDLSRNQFVSLPNMCQVPRLKYLNLENCPRLQALQGLPSCLVNVSYCISLETLSDPIKQCNSAISATCYNCFKLVEKQGIESIALPCLMQFLKDYKFKPELDRFDFVGPGNEIPEWFNHQSVGSSVSLELHAGWLSDEWMGFAICVVFETLEIYQPLAQVELLLGFKVNGEDWRPSLGMLCGVVPAHFWLNFHRYHSRKWQDIYCQLEFSFHFVGGVGKVKKCGVRIVYEAESNVSISEEALEFPDGNVVVGCVSEEGSRALDDNQCM